MKHEKFNEIVINRLNKCKTTLIQKDKEYSSKEDRLHNFVVAAKARNVTPATALDGMLMKHIVSMWDIIDKLEDDLSYVPEKVQVAEKLGDVINYVLLLEGIIEERRQSLFTNSSN